MVALGGPGVGMDLIFVSGDELEEEEGFVALVGTLGGAGLDLNVRIYTKKKYATLKLKSRTVGSSVCILKFWNFKEF